MQISQPPPLAVAAPFAIAKMIEEAESSQFPQTLLSSLRGLGLHADHCSIFIYDEDFKPSHIGTGSEVLLDGASDASRMYAGEMYRVDPLRELLRKGSQATVLLRLDADKIADSVYRDACFRSIGTVEKASVVRRTEGHCSSLNLYRRDTSGRFTPKELLRIERYAPILAALVEKHVESRRAISICSPAQATKAEIKERLTALGGKLSKREAEVCTLILLGHTSESIGLNMGLGHSTVLTYRKRAYAKLDISSANELFHRCLR